MAVSKRMQSNNLILRRKVEVKKKNKQTGDDVRMKSVE